MAQSIYARAASRGFPAIDFGGQTGEGRTASSGGGVLSWQDHSRSGAETRGYDLSSGQSSRQYDPAAPGDTGADWILDAPLWGLPGGTRPDELPRTESDGLPPQGPRLPASGTLEFGQYQGGLEMPTHAAPFPNLPMGNPYDHAQVIEYFEEENAIHGVNFGGHRQRNDIPQLKQIPGWSHLPVNDGGSTDLQPLTGPIRSQAGLDAVQGYGGGGPGPGGTNDAHAWGYWQDQAEYPVDITPVIVSAGEVPFRTELPQMFVASDQTVGGPRTIDFGYVAPTVNTIPQAPYEPSPVLSGGPLAAGDPAYAGSFWS